MGLTSAEAAAPPPGSWGDPVLAGNTSIELGGYDPLVLSAVFTGPEPDIGTRCDWNDDGALVKYLMYDPSDLNHSWKNVAHPSPAPGHEGLQVELDDIEADGLYTDQNIEVTASDKTQPGIYTVRIPVTQEHSYVSKPGSCTSVGAKTRTTKWASLTVTVTAGSDFLEDQIRFSVDKTRVKAGQKIKVTVSVPSYLAGTRVHLMFPKTWTGDPKRTGKAKRLKRSGNRAVATLRTGRIASFGSLYPVVAKTRFTDRFNGWLKSPFIDYNYRSKKWMKKRSSLKHPSSVKKSTRVRFRVKAPKLLAKTKVRVQHRADSDYRWRTLTTARVKANGKVSKRVRVPSSGSVRLKFPKTVYSLSYTTKAKKIRVS